MAKMAQNTGGFGECRKQLSGFSLLALSQKRLTSEYHGDIIGRRAERHASLRKSVYEVSRRLISKLVSYVVCSA